MTVFVLDSRKKPLMPCSEKRARLLLERGRARVHRMVPFAIRLLDRLQAESVLQPVRLKADPGSKTTGLALVREKETVHPETGEVVLTAVVLMLLELQHRGADISRSMEQRSNHRGFRRSKLRYRPARFQNRARPKGWLAPSLQHRVDTTDSLVNRLMRLAPITALSQELVRFDMQQMQNPEISGAEYQQGTLAGYEIREYLLEKWGRECVYCGAENTPLEIDHIHPRSRGGSNRVSNLAIACHDCNQRKGNMPLEQFLAKAPERAEKILKQAKVRLNDAAAVNSTRWALFQRLKATGLDVEVASGGRTKWNRIRLGLPKAHCIDAACVGHVDAINQWQQPVLGIKATGRGSYQRTRLTKHGFPRGYLTRSKSAFGFQTGDMVHAVVPARAGRKPGKKEGTYLGRVAIRASGSFNIQTGNGLVQGIHHRFCTLIQRADGYGYAFAKIALT
ncbi:HNH endonuclease [Acidithiobacillus ferrivorans]|nr:HNH endonuclease [Acidithiobacillus ferrivorans]